MRNGDFLKFSLLVLGVILVLGFQNGSADQASIYALLVSVASAIGLLLVFAVTNERVTEVIKSIFRKIFGSVGFLQSWQPDKAGSWFLALLLAYLGVTNRELNVFAGIDFFNGVDANMLEYANIAIVWIASNILHKPMEKFAGKAQLVVGGIG